MTPDEIRARVSVLMRTFQNAGGGPAGWKALAVWTLEWEAAVAGSAGRDATDKEPK